MDLTFKEAIVIIENNPETLNKETIFILEDGKRVAVLISPQEYGSLKNTLQILSGMKFIGTDKSMSELNRLIESSEN